MSSIPTTGLAFDVFKRDLPDYTLKTAARYFGLASAQRTYIEGRDIARVWREDPSGSWPMLGMTCSKPSA